MKAVERSEISKKLIFRTWNFILLGKQFKSDGDIIKNKQTCGQEVYGWTTEKQNWVGEVEASKSKAMRQEWFYWDCMNRKFIKNSGNYFETEISCFVNLDFIRRANEEYEVTFHVLSKSHFIEVWSIIKI